MTEPLTFPALESCEELLTEPSEWYYRQIHPTFLCEGIINPDAFQSGDRKASGTRSSKQTAQDAYEESRRDYPNRKTAGTWGVTLAQVLTAKGRLVDDSACPPPEGYTHWPTGHTYLDQRIADKGVRSQMRGNLARKAAANGCQYAAPDEPSAPGTATGA
jgi:hypothetical protein